MPDLQKNYPFISIIIPTFHDWERLQECVRAIQEQTYLPDRFEVIIVNNDPDSKPPEGFRLPENFTLIDEGQRGSYAARNKGIAKSNGEIIAFTDSDCVPAHDWLENSVSRLQGGADRLAGNIQFIFNGPKLSVAEMYEKAFGFNQGGNAREGTSVTANLITWRYVIDKVGLFNDTLLSGGDLEWGWRASSAGFEIQYAPDVIVYHPARSRIRDLLKQQRRIVGGAVMIRRRLGKVALMSWLFRGLMPPIFGLNRISKNKDLSVYEKLVAFMVLYLLKIFGAWQGVLILSGISRPRRA